jgi:tripartite ATP-independent transporter DctM subunit
MESKKNVFLIIEDWIAWGSLILLALIPFSEMIARVFFKTGIPSSYHIMVHLLLALGLVSGMITTRNSGSTDNAPDQSEHLSISFLQYLSNEKVKKVLAVFTNIISTFVTTIVFWCSISFISLGIRPGKMIGFIPNQVLALVMPLGYLVMAIRFARMVPLKGWGRALPAASMFLGTFCAIPAIVKLIWGLDSPEIVYVFIDHLSEIAYALRIPGVIFLILSALAGTPLFVVLGGLSILLIQGAWGEIDVTANEIYNSLTQPSIVAIPLFTLTGFFLSESKAGERLVRTFRSFFSWIPGGMIIATVIICAFFTSFTGASGVTILALGGILHTILTEKSKYPEKFTLGLLTSVGGIGLLFPPSLPLLMVGATTMTNTIHLFAGGLIPGFILILSMIVFGIISSFHHKIPLEKFDPKQALLSLKGAIWEIFLPVLLITGYFTGILSPVEIGAAAVIYAFVIEVLVHRDIKLKELSKVFAKTIPIIGGILSILALSKALSYYIVDTQAPENLARWFNSAIQSKILFLFLLNLALLVVGCLMDIFSAILVVLPLVVPLGQIYGIDPVHLGIIFVINLEVGFLTPPVGMNLFLATYRFKKSFVEICRDVFPFLIIQLTVVFLVTYVPWCSTYLKSFF